MTAAIAASPKLQQLLDRLADAIADTGKLIEQIRLQGDSDGLSWGQTRELIFDALRKRQLADRTIRKYLPVDLKFTTKARPAKSDSGIQPSSNLDPGTANDAVQTDALQKQATKIPDATLSNETAHESSTTQPQREVAQLDKQLAEKNAEIEIQKADIEQLKQKINELEQQLLKASFRPASEYVQSSDNNAKRECEHAKLLLPFTVKSEVDVKGTLVPIEVEVQPANKRVYVVLDLERAGRMES